MKKLAFALALAIGLAAAFSPAEAARRAGGGSLCFEDGCTGSQCIYCNR